MSLVNLALPTVRTDLPAEVAALLREADARIERFQAAARIPGFVPCDFSTAYGILRGIAEEGLAPGTRFCEWGSGFGVVTCMAAMLGYEAFGIEIEPDLVVRAEELGGDFNLTVQFLQGSFVPSDGEECLDAVYSQHPEGLDWFTMETSDCLAEVGLGHDDFDLVFAYPWPAEERVVSLVFNRFASPGALLLTCHANHEFRLRRKHRGKKSRK